MSYFLTPQPAIAPPQSMPPKYPKRPLLPSLLDRLKTYLTPVPPPVPKVDVTYPVDIIKASTCDTEDANAPGWTVEYVCYGVQNKLDGDTIYLDALPDEDTDPDKRTYIEIPLEQLSMEWIQDMYNMLCTMKTDDGKPYPDTLAWTGVFKSPTGRRYFLPCLDMKSFDPLSNMDVQVSAYFRWMKLPNPKWVKTDSSWHAYFPVRIPIERMPEFIGTAMLVNGGNKVEFVDANWLGVTLIRKRLTLRLSRKALRADSCAPFCFDPFSTQGRQFLEYLKKPAVAEAVQQLTSYF